MKINLNTLTAFADDAIMDATNSTRSVQLLRDAIHDVMLYIPKNIRPDAYKSVNYLITKTIEFGKAIDKI